MIDIPSFFFIRRILIRRIFNPFQNNHNLQEVTCPKNKRKM